MKQSEVIIRRSWVKLILSIAHTALILLQREHLGDFTNSFCTALSKQQPHSYFHILWMSKKSEQNRRSVISVNSSSSHDAFNYCCLTDVANMHRCLKTRINSSCMEKYIYCCLWEKKANTIWCFYNGKGSLLYYKRVQCGGWRSVWDLWFSQW